MLQSFGKNVGVPRALRVFSDGTLTQAHFAVLAGLPCELVFGEVDEVCAVHENIHHHLHKHPLMRKMAMLTHLGRQGPVLYSDTDIVFFPAAKNALLTDLTGEFRFMRDARPAFDLRLSGGLEHVSIPLNSGFLYFEHPLDWESALAVLPFDDAWQPNHFSEQTIAHLAVTQAGAKPLDASRYILELDDQFRLADAYTPLPGIVCRHYTNPIRHKFWRASF
jgi:hypothetical protein